MRRRRFRTRCDGCGRVDRRPKHHDGRSLHFPCMTLADVALLVGRDTRVVGPGGALLPLAPAQVAGMLDRRRPL